MSSIYINHEQHLVIEAAMLWERFTPPLPVADLQPAITPLTLIHANLLATSMNIHWLLSLFLQSLTLIRRQTSNFVCPNIQRLTCYIDCWFYGSFSSTFNYFFIFSNFINLLGLDAFYDSVRQLLSHTRILKHHCPDKQIVSILSVGSNVRPKIKRNDKK